LVLYTLFHEPISQCLSFLIPVGSEIYSLFLHDALPISRQCLTGSHPPIPWSMPDGRGCRRSVPRRSARFWVLPWFNPFPRRRASRAALGVPAPNRKTSGPCHGRSLRRNRPEK